MEEINKTFLEKVVDYLKTNWKKVAIIALAVVIAYNFFSCGSSEGNSNGIKPDNWYHNDLVNYQNCVISESLAKTDYVFVSYWPVCKECEEHGTLAIAYVTDDERVLKTYTCDCGGNTTIRIETY